MQGRPDHHDPQHWPWAESIFRRLFEATSQAVVVHDAAGEVVAANPAATRLLGLSGRGAADLHPASDLPWVMTEFERLRHVGGGVARAVPVLRHAGSTFFADIDDVAR